jgi:hypothetical protein
MTKEEISLGYKDEEPSTCSCENCKYELLSSEVEPCCDCMNSHKNYFEAKTSKALEEPSVNDTLGKIRAEIAECGSIRVTFAITDETKTDKGIEKLASDILARAKEQVLDIIDKYKAESEETA